jgi:hypothetical protein
MESTFVDVCQRQRRGPGRWPGRVHTPLIGSQHQIANVGLHPTWFAELPDLLGHPFDHPDDPTRSFWTRRDRRGRLRIWRLGVRIPRGAPPNPLVSGPVAGSRFVSGHRTATKLRPRRRALPVCCPGRLRPPATPIAHPDSVTAGQPGVEAPIGGPLWPLRRCSPRRPLSSWASPT